MLQCAGETEEPGNCFLSSSGKTCLYHPCAGAYADWWVCNRDLGTALDVSNCPDGMVALSFAHCDALTIGTCMLLRRQLPQKRPAFLLVLTWLLQRACTVKSVRCVVSACLH